jgi:hypothetical protein
MNFPSFPWLELTLLLPILGAMIVSFIWTPALAARWCIGFLLITLIGTTHEIWRPCPVRHICRR